ncbi:uncharacterized protein LOC109140692 [Larimichthys crocea]|uniref:uncharacterized protein LOC109140692 n=1 Tax=Larimichthys crocea TaxID=215358 RepID=UPI000900943E|nr:uncharacterized protein LOC109140692 [Larimichthys crocea]
MNLFCFSLEGSMDSLYEAVQSSSDVPPRAIPSRSSSRSCSRSCSPAVLLDDNTKWRGSGRSISMEMPQTQNYNKKKRRTHVSKSVSDNEALDNPSCNTAVWQPAKRREDLVHVTKNHNEETRKPKHRTETKEGKGAHHSGTKKKEKLPSSQHGVTESKPAVKRSQKPGKKPGGKSSGKEGSKKSHNATVPSPPCSMSPPIGSHYLDVPYRSDMKQYLGRSSTLPAQENATPGRCIEMATLPGGATPTHTHHHQQRWSNPGDRSPAWGTVQHTCRRPLTEYRVYSHEFTAQHGKELDGRKQQGTAQDGNLKQDCKPQIPTKVPRSITDVDLSEPNHKTSTDTQRACAACAPCDTGQLLKLNMTWEKIVYNEKDDLV